METNNRPYSHPNSDANVINLGSELQVSRLASLNLLYFCRNLQSFSGGLVHLLVCTLFLMSLGRGPDASKLM